MDKQEEFFSPKHKQLLNIATWAKYLAWVVFGFYIFYTAGRFVEIQNSYLISAMMSTGQRPDFMETLAKNPLYATSIAVDMLSIFLKGVVYFLTLKGISLGLNMIVETDINYREQMQEGGTQ